MVLHPSVIAKTPGLHLALVVFLIAVSVAGLLFSQSTTSGVWVMHTQSVINELEGSLSNLLAVESGARGYVITQDGTFINPVDGSAQQAQQHLDRVIQLTQDNPVQQQRADSLKAVGLARIVAARHLLSISGKTPDRELLIAELNTGKRLMDEFTQQKQIMVTTELSLLQARQQGMKKIQNAAGIAIGVLCLLSIFTVSWSFRTAEKRRELLSQLNTRLRATEQETRDLFENAPCGYHSVDADGLLLRINETELNWLGYSRDEVVGKLSIREILSEESCKTFDRNFAQFKQTGSVRSLEYDYRRKDGTEFPVLLNSDVVYDQNHEFVHSRSTIFDITQRKQLEAALYQKNEELEKANLAKDRFLASMSHELRTPLNSILGFSGILLMDLSGPLNEEQRKQIGYMQTSGKHLLSLINDILDLAKIESGNVTLSLKPLTLKPVVDEVIEVLSPLASAKNIELVVRPLSDSDMVMGDLRSLSQITINLINNAIKFTDKGSVTVELSRNHNQLRLSVIDTGIGISAEDQQKLFKGFVQIAHDERIDEGTGLGLHLSQKLAEMMNGRIELESETGKGSRFTLVLPIIEA